MFIRSNLFSKGHPAKREPRLSDALDRHTRTVLNKIRGLSNLDQLTDAFLGGLVRSALVAPLAISFDKMGREFRSEQFDGSQLPFEQFGDRGRLYQRQVVRLSIPFSGEEDLLQYAPSTCGLTYPRGEVCGNTIQFDVILWGSPDDEQRVRQEIRQNLDLIADCAVKINQQVKAYNEALPAQVKAAFDAKLGELAKQHALFDDLGIPAMPKPPTLLSSPALPKPKPAKERVVHITQYIENQFVQHLAQTNYNGGDVNNEIQGVS